MNDSYDENYSYDESGYDTGYGDVPTVKNYLTWYGLYFLATFLGCGIGGIILAIVWACKSDKPARQNWAKAQLILFGIAVALYFVFFIFAMIFGTAAISFGLN